MASFLNRVGRALRLVESSKPVDDGGPKPVTLHVEETGSSGTEIFSGYYSEEYLQNLRGTQGADLWDKIRRSDPKIEMALASVKNPIIGAKWSVQPGDQGEEFKKHAEFIEQVLFRDLLLPWNSQLSEILTHLDFGLSVFEVIHKVVMNDPKFGTYNSIGKLAWRSPRTIERWNLNPDGSLLSVSQYAFGDLQRLVDIPGDFLLVFTHKKEGDNYEGVSALRPCYGPWVRKNTFLKLMAIGIEKFAVPTPTMTVPAGKESSPEYSRAKRMLEKYVSHQQQYLMKPEGWTLEFSKSDFDPSKIRDVIERENDEIVSSFMANFLSLGTGGNSGSRALSTDLSSMFLMSIAHVGDSICQVFNRNLIPSLIKMNFGPQPVYPKLAVSGITDKPGSDLAGSVKTLVDARVLQPDDPLEDQMREKFGLAKRDQATIRKAPAIPQPGIPAQAPKFAERYMLAEKPKTPKALITIRAQEVQDAMKSMVSEIGSGVIKDLMAAKKRATPSQYLSLTSKIEPTGSRDYKAVLRDLMTSIAYDARRMAQSETGIKLSESVKLASVPRFEDLPPAIQAQVNAQVGLLSTFQIQDLLKGLFFQFNSSVTSTDSDAQLEGDLQAKLFEFMDGASIAAGAGNTVSKIVNEARSEFFFEPDVLDQIESFTFVNGDPVSPICQDLAGTVFSKDDPNMDRYSPPLHHNAVLDSCLVETDRGPVFIRELKVGDMVLTHKNRFKPITEWMDRFEDKEFFTITLENGKSIDITAEHPVLTAKGWKRVDELILTDEIGCREDICNA